MKIKPSDKKLSIEGDFLWGGGGGGSEKANGQCNILNTQLDMNKGLVMIADLDMTDEL